MRTHSFDNVALGGTGGVKYVDIDLAGTALDPIAKDAPVAVTLKQDVPAVGPPTTSSTATGAVTVRISDPNKLRVRAAGLGVATISFQVTDLTP